MNVYSKKALIPHAFKRYVDQDLDFPVKPKIIKESPSFFNFYNYFNVINSLYLYVTNYNLESFLKDTKLKEVTFLQGYEKISSSRITDSSVFGCVGKITKDTAIIAFRGTVTSLDWYEDFHYKQEDLSKHIKNAKGKISKGFSGIYYNNDVISKKGFYCDSKCDKSIFSKEKWCYTNGGSWDYCDSSNVTSIKTQLETWMNNHPEITKYVITCLSLGASLATICATDNASKVENVYLYTSPRVGNRDFVDYYNNDLNLGVKTYHFHTSGDAVPTMPFSAMPDNTCYNHVALPHYIIDYKLENPVCDMKNIGLYHVSSAFISNNALRQWKQQIQWSE